MTAVAALLLTAFAPPAAAEGAPARITDSIIQIGIAQKVSSLTLRPRGRFAVVDQKTGETHDLVERRSYPVQARPGILHFGPYLFLGQVRLLPKGTQDYVEVGQKRYHGSLLLKPNKDATFTLIQETGLEEYLYGVLPKEMSPDWPREALRAQAVVARTFTLSNLGKFQRSGFDLSDDVRSQVYVGLDGQDPRATAAVRDTDGEVLYHKGRLLGAFFHSCCGGHTTSAASTWGAAPPAAAARGVRDSFCAASPHSRWTAYFTFDDILGALARSGRIATRLKGVGLGPADRSGHLRSLKLFTDGGTFVVRANDFRTWMGSTELKSTKILRTTRRSKGYEFTGSGYGHGVGLCQWGARSMAERGKTYRQILQHYFPGADVRARDDG